MLTWSFSDSVELSAVDTFGSSLGSSLGSPLGSSIPTRFSIVSKLQELFSSAPVHGLLLTMVCLMMPYKNCYP